MTRAAEPENVTSRTASSAPAEVAVLDAVESALVRIRRRQARGSLARPALEAQQAPEGGALSMQTLSVIDAIAAGGTGDLTVGHVADRLAIDPSRASRIVAEAVRSGHVRRIASQEDGRRSCLVLTPTGEAAVTAAHHTRQRFYAELLDGWQSTERAEFARLLTKFVDALEDRAPQR